MLQRYPSISSNKGFFRLFRTNINQTLRSANDASASILSFNDLAVFIPSKRTSDHLFPIAINQTLQYNNNRRAFRLHGTNHGNDNWSRSRTIFPPIIPVCYCFGKWSESDTSNCKFRWVFAVFEWNFFFVLKKLGIFIWVVLRLFWSLLN